MFGKMKLAQVLPSIVVTVSMLKLRIIFINTLSRHMFYNSMELSWQTIIVRGFIPYFDYPGNV